MINCSCGQHSRAAGITSRREFLSRWGLGLGALSLASLISDDARAAAGAQGKTTHFPARAKHVIHIFAAGAPSQVDTWDPKPELTKYDGKSLPGLTGVALGSPFTFSRKGQSGIEVSEVFPALGSRVDQMAIIRTLQTDIPAHD